jgi:O-succinylbenzoic acid--CoA ligase
MDDQTFQWHGRADNVVLSGGLKIYPEELELRCANLITDPFYFSKRKHSELSEALILVVETNELNEDELLAALRTVLSPLEMPKQVVCMEEFNRTHSGKIKRL